MTPMIADQSAAPMKVQSNKKIYDWAELDKAVTICARLAKPTELSAAVLDLAIRLATHSKHMAQLDERVIAVAQPHCIDLWYGHTSPGCGIESLSMMRNVKVFPAQGGRTSYEVDMSVNGHFANRHLPLRARDRGGKSIYRNTKWYYGQSGIYQPGIGPIYGDIGPDVCNLSHGKLLQNIGNASFISQSWRDKAAAFLDRLRDAVSPFGDAVLRYASIGLKGEDVDRNTWIMTTHICGYEVEVRSGYGIIVRIKHPAISGPTGWTHRDDLAIGVCGPAAGWQDADEITYVVGLMHQGSGRVASRDLLKKDAPQDLCVYRKPAPVIELARQWCGDHIYIPC